MLHEVEELLPALVDGSDPHFTIVTKIIDLLLVYAWILLCRKIYIPQPQTITLKWLCCQYQSMGRGSSEGKLISH
jgi:hypothetical protein